jgi:signal transduction histidine kinase
MIRLLRAGLLMALAVLATAADIPVSGFALKPGSTAQAKGLSLEVDAAGFPEQVEGDLPKLRQVLLNLLGNALKFTEAGHVRLRARWQEDRATFAVEDT